MEVPAGAVLRGEGGRARCAQYTRAYRQAGLLKGWKRGL